MEEKKTSILKLDNRINGVYKILFVCLVILLLGYFKKAGYIGYETNDDLFMSAIPAGWYGEYYPFTVYSNIFIGYLLAGITSILPIFNWTTIFSLILIILSYILFGVWCIDNKGKITGSFLAIVFVLSTWISIVNRYNFSKSGSLIISTGIVVLLGNFLDEKESSAKRIQTVTAGMLIIVGSLFRYSTLLANMIHCRDCLHAS